MFPTCVHNNLLLGCVCLYIQNVMYVPCQVWSVIRVKFRKQTMLWCLIFHSAELQNYVPALHGIMFGSFNFNKKCNNLCSALLELCWEYFTYN